MTLSKGLRLSKITGHGVQHNESYDSSFSHLNSTILTTVRHTQIVGNLYQIGSAERSSLMVFCKLKNKIEPVHCTWLARTGRIQEQILVKYYIGIKLSGALHRNTTQV